MRHPKEAALEAKVGSHSPVIIPHISAYFRIRPRALGVRFVVMFTREGSSRESKGPVSYLRIQELAGPCSRNLTALRGSTQAKLALMIRRSRFIEPLRVRCTNVMFNRSKLYC